MVNGFMYHNIMVIKYFGEILFTFQTGGSVCSGPSIVDGVIYVGSGYERIVGGTANNKVYALAS